MKQVVACGIAAVLCTVMLFAVFGSPQTCHIVIGPDISASVPLGTRVSIVDAIRKAAGQLQRGDLLVIIPITADAQNDAPGRIIRFDMNTKREPFDQDIARVRKHIDSELDVLLQVATEEPFQQTDILGTIRLAAEEFSRTTQPTTRRVLLIVSDLLQDNAAFAFKNDEHLKNEETARTLAVNLGNGISQSLAGVDVLLGSVPSDDMRALPMERREAVRVFWTELLQQQGAIVTWSTDGAGQLPHFLERPDTRRMMLGYGE